MTRRILVLGVVVALGLACDGGTDEGTSAAGPGGLSDEMPEDLPAGECREGGTDAEDCESGSTSTGGSGSTSGQAGDAEMPECTVSDDCQGAGACAADWEDGVRTPFSCRFTCIPTLNETAWCGDDASCCDADAVCTPRGYCIVPESEEDSGGSDNVVTSPKLSDEMPEDLPAGGATPMDTVASAAKDGG